MAVILDMIRNGSNKKNVDLYKVTGEHKYKLESPTFCVARFKNDYAKSEYLQETNFLIFDIDDLKENVDVIKDEFKKSKEVFSTFKSFSGNGLYVIYVFSESVRSAEQYKQNYRYYAKKIFYDYGVKVDGQAKDVRRLVTIPCDKDIYVNFNAKSIHPQLLVLEERKECQAGKLDLNLVSEWFPTGVLGYADWFNLALGLAPYGEAGKDLFVEISQRGHYNDSIGQIESKFDNIAKTTKVRSDRILTNLGERYGKIRN
jgi:hypothetical protein